MNKALYNKFIVLLTSRLLQTNSKLTGDESKGLTCSLSFIHIASRLTRTRNA
jgi:hypothetical protein